MLKYKDLLNIDFEERKMFATLVVLKIQLIILIIQT